MKTIKISEIMDAARNGHPVTTLKLRDASRMFSNATGDLEVKPTIFYSARVRPYQSGDEMIEVGKKLLNLSELNRRLREWIGRGLVYLVQNGRAFEGELVE